MTNMVLIGKRHVIPTVNGSLIKWAILPQDVTSSDLCKTAMPACTLKKLRVYIDTIPSSVIVTPTLRVRVLLNGVATALDLTCDDTGGNGTLWTLSQDVSVSEDDLLSIQYDSYNDAASNWYVEVSIDFL